MNHFKMKSEAIKEEFFEYENDSDSSILSDKDRKSINIEYFTKSNSAVDMDHSVEQNIEDKAQSYNNIKIENDDDMENLQKLNHSEVIHDIFGDSDEEEDFEGFNANEIEKEVSVKDKEASVTYNEFNVKVNKVPELKLFSHNDHDDEIINEPSNIMTVFENIIEKQKIEKRLNRPKKRDNVDYLNDMDDRIAYMINKMRLAAIEDEEMYHLGQPGFKKLLLLPEVRNLLRMSNIKLSLVESKFLNIMATWLKPLPKHILPPLDIRILLLKSLLEFPLLTSDILKESNIGKAVMYLYKHPKEISENKKIAGHLINEWSRPIFKLSSDYNEMTKEDRMERDRNIVVKRKLVDNDASAKRNNEYDEMDNEQAVGMKQSNKDYIIRPNWRVGNKRSEIDEDDEDDIDDDNNNIKIPGGRETKRMKVTDSSNNKYLGLERTFRKIKDAGKKRKMIQRAANISIQGKGLDV